MLWCIIPLLLLLTAAMAHAETSRHPEQIPYPEETIIPLWKLTDDQYALLRTIYAGIRVCQAEIPLPTRPTMEELDPVVREHLRFIPCAHASDVLEHALCPYEHADAHKENATSDEDMLIPLVSSIAVTSQKPTATVR